VPVNFFCEDIEFQLDHPEYHQRWIDSIVKKENRVSKVVNYIFCSDEKLLELNQKYLAHNTYTDILTFNQSDDNTYIEADIFISIPRVEENTISLNQEFHHELRRVMAHGLLHLMGFDDHTEVEQKLMREKEEACLSLWAD